MIPVVEQLGGGERRRLLVGALARRLLRRQRDDHRRRRQRRRVRACRRKAGHPISFLQFFKYGIPVTLVSLVLATGYVMVRYA